MPIGARRSTIASPDFGPITQARAYHDAPPLAKTADLFRRERANADRSVVSNPVKSRELDASVGAEGVKPSTDGEQGSFPLGQGSSEQEQGSALRTLVCRAQAGDAEAFAGLVRAYQRQVLSVAYRLLGNTEDARDVSQDAFIRAFRSLSQLEDPSRFGPWLMRVVTNLSLNFRRSRHLRRVVSLDEQPSLAGAVVEDKRRTEVWEGETGALSEELHAEVSRAIEGLPERQRLALILFSVEGMPQKDVAQILECSIELVKWNVFQARRKLKEILADFL